MKDRFNLITIAIIYALFALVFFVRMYQLTNPELQWVFKFVYPIAIIMAIYLLIVNGTVRSTRYWKVFVVLAVVCAIGAVFKIMHFVGADETLLVGNLGIMLLYIIRFVNKQKKMLLDILKLLWVISAFGLLPLIVLHAVSSDYTYVSGGFFMLMFLAFTYQEWKGKQS